MFSDRNEKLLKKDANGEYFFDRNYRTFAVILDFYRSGKLYIPPSISEEILQDELEFFQLPITLDRKSFASKMQEISLKKAEELQTGLLTESLDAVKSAVEIAAKEGKCFLFLFFVLYVLN